MPRGPGPPRHGGGGRNSSGCFVTKIWGGGKIGRARVGPGVSRWPCRSSPRRVRYPPPNPSPPPPIVPPRPVAFGVWMSTPAINSTASTASMMISAFLTCAIRGLLIPPFDGLPVECVEPGRNVIGAPVLILQVVSVLPHIDTEHRGQVFHVRAVLVRVRLDQELSARIRQQPRPAAAELADARFLELLLERVVAAERAADRIAQLAGRSAAPIRAHDGPEDRVVRVPARVVAQDGAHVFRHRADSAEQVLDRLLGQLGVLLESAIGVVHVSGVVLVVVDLHRLGVDVRLERIERVREWWKLICHGGSPFYLKLLSTFEISLAG